MECERCCSCNVEIKKEAQGFIANKVTLEQYSITNIYMKCNDCDFEFMQSE
ncbi:MAG: hypothetical protein ACRDDY_17000 [Clostridium sp.]|uniref:hypothetical protein n=1 Tax=Clostridium sp. TaxID=1506 RepID=UPI003EE74ADE